jgi:hypothetical protein
MSTKNSSRKNFDQLKAETWSTSTDNDRPRAPNLGQRHLIVEGPTTTSLPNLTFVPVNEGWMSQAAGVAKSGGYCLVA